VLFRSVGHHLHARAVLGPERGVAQSTSSAASVLQASGFRRDVTVFRLNATAEGHSGSGRAFRRNTAERVYTIEAAHNPEVAGSNPAPATAKGPARRGLLSFLGVEAGSNFGPFLAQAARRRC